MSPQVLVLRGTIGVALVALLGAGSVYMSRRPTGPGDDKASCCAKNAETIDASAPPSPVPLPSVLEVAERSRPLNVPDTPLVDQRGRPVRFYEDLVKGRVVAINFIFTTCKGVCPPMGATFGKLEPALKRTGGRLISVSVDPVNDTPERLDAWSRQFHAGPDWTLVTGTKQDVDGLLRALGVFSADKANHSPFVLLRNDRAGVWRRVHGLSSPGTILAAIEAMTASTSKNVTTGSTDPAGDQTPDSPSHRYFTDVPLVNQNGETMRLYSDLIRGKVVVIHVFFASCGNTCPIMMTTYQRLQEHLADRLGRDVHLISLTVDPDHDGVPALRDYARKIGARPGWHLLTGTKENLRFALGKLGLAAERREEHSNIFIMGNDATHLWKKVRGLASVEQTIEALDEVLADRGGAALSSPTAEMSRGE